MIHEPPTWIKVLKRYSALIYASMATLLCIWGFRTIESQQPAVDASFRSFSSYTTDPDSMLNHANTYYWWGRYRKNTMPEFDSAAALAQRAMELAAARKAVDGDTAAFRSRRRQAEKIIALAERQKEICRFNVASHIPLYMEAMRHDPSYMQEDADNEEVPLIALRGGIGRLIELLAPNRVQTIGSLSHFALVNARTSNQLAAEMLIQELNNRTRMYTVSEHELARILGRDSVEIGDLMSDSSSLARVAEAFSTEELALIDFTENDRVDGIYYYGMRLRLWNRTRGMNPQNVYTEYMVRDRVFNQLNGIILPLFFAFILLAAALNLIVNAVGTRTGLFGTIHPLYLPLSFVLGVGVQYALTVFGLVNFLNPAPEDFYVVDAAELWVIVYPLTFLVPALVTYLVLGKMDNLIGRFRSELENPAALFALVSGTLMTVPYVFTYLHVIRFGTHLDMAAILPCLAAALLASFLIARHWSAIVNFPERVDPVLRLLTWLSVLTYVYLTFRLLGELILHYDASNMWEWLTYSLLPAAAVLEGSRWLLRRLRTSSGETGREQSVPVLPKGITSLSLVEADDGLLVHSSSTRAPAASLYVSARRGMPASETMAGHFRTGGHWVTVRIDFCCDPPRGREVHYHPFALSFQKMVAFIKFNDTAETARKTSNLLGRLLSSVTSYGGLIVDERKTPARDPGEVARMLLDTTGHKPTVWLMDHVEMMRDEDMELLKALVMEIHSRRTEQQSNLTRQTGKGHLPLLILCGHGEYGLRDRVLTTLGSLASKEQSGMLEFEMVYGDAAKDILERESLPIQVKLQLESLLHRERKDHVPLIIVETLKEVRTRGILFKREGLDLPLARLDELKSLPDVSLGFGLPTGLDASGGLRHAMTAAAYLSDGEGRFSLPAVAHVLGIDRMTMLQHLKEAERLNLVYDLKGHANFYRYAFTDRSLAAALKELENPRQKDVSQLANEFYRGFVEHHCSLPQGGFSGERPVADHSTGRIDTDTLAMIAERAYAVYPAFPMLAYEVNSKAACIFGGNGIARFEDALACTERAMEMANSLQPSERDDISQSLFDLKKLKFEMLLETGGYRNTDMVRLLDEIQKDPHHQSQEEVERRSFELSEARLRFLRFKSPDDPILGEAICARIKEVSTNAVERLRAEFYSIKLVPSNLLVFGGHPDWPKKALEIDVRYRNLLAELEMGYAESMEKKELYRQVLNDYGGSFLTDKVMPLTIRKVEGDDGKRIQGLLETIGMESPEKALTAVEGLLTRRIALEAEPAAKVSLTPSNITEQLEELLSNEDPTIDKRGLCFTLNYLSRAYRTTGDFGRSVMTGLMSYRFNTHVGDLTGCCMAAGTVGYGHAAFGEAAEAYRWFERSFGHAWALGHRSAPEMAMQMRRMAKTLKDKQMARTAEFYLRQIGLRVVCPQFPFEAITRDTADLLLTSREGLRPMKFADRPNILIGEDPVLFLNWFLEWVNSSYLKPNESGQGALTWVKGEKSLFEWVSGTEHSIGEGLTRMNLTIHQAESERGYAIQLIRDETPSWHVEFITGKTEE